MLRTVRGVIAGLLVAFPTVLVAAGEQPDPVEVIFQTRHLDLIQKGSGIVYKFEHNVSDEKLLGKAFSDDIKLDVTDITADNQSIVNVTVFTGERQRPVQNFDGLSINPAFVWFLDKCVENYRLVSGGNQAYLKGRLRDAFHDKATIEAVKTDYNGKSVDGHKITLVPFDGDPNAHKMNGFEKSKFTIVVSKDVPGYFVELGSDIFSTQAGTGKVQDRMVLVSAGGQ